MKKSHTYPVTLVLLILLSLASCKKSDPVVTPGGTTTPGSNTGTSGTTKSSAKDVTTFVFAALTPSVSATVTTSAKTITATVPATTDLTKLVPTITLSDKATISPASGVSQDFSKAVTYTVTAEDGSTQTYTVTVSKAPATTSVCRVASIAATLSTGGSSKTTYLIDSQNRLVQEKFENNDKDGTLLTSTTNTYTYNADGFLTSNIKTYWYAISSKYDTKEVAYRYTYQNGRLSKEDYSYTYADASINGFSTTYQYEYDTQGNVSKRNVTSSSGSPVTYTYANGKLSNITSNDATFTLNEQGFVTKRLNANGSSVLYEYNGAGQNTRSENYDTKGVKTGYIINEYSDKILLIPTNPLGFKGHPTSIPYQYGVSGQATKYAAYTIDATGKETKNNEYIWTYQGDSRGNVTSYTSTYSFVSGTTMVTNTTNYTYEYQGCQ